MPDSDSDNSLMVVERDLRTYLPRPLPRFLGYRDEDEVGEPLQIPPFTWLARVPIKYEIWFLTFIGSFVSIALIEIVNATAFADKGVPLIIASFGASAVLLFATIESPLAQPRHIVGGHIIAAIIGVAVTRLFRLASPYFLDETTETGELGHVVWLNGAFAMSLSLLAMQMTGTVHPPGGATALIASVDKAAVLLSWRFIYLVIIAALLMIGWALIINNLGRRRYPTYWLDGKRLFVRTVGGKEEARSVDGLRMDALEGRNQGFSAMERAMSVDVERAAELQRQYSAEHEHTLSHQLSRQLSRQISRRSDDHHHPHMHMPGFGHTHAHGHQQGQTHGQGQGQGQGIHRVDSPVTSMSRHSRQSNSPERPAHTYSPRALHRSPSRFSHASSDMHPSWSIDVEKRAAESAHPPALDGHHVHNHNTAHTQMREDTLTEAPAQAESESSGTMVQTPSVKSPALPPV